MAKTKTKQIGEAIKGLNANANTNSNLIEHDLASVNLNAYSPSSPIDYQFAPLDVQEESVVDNSLQDLAVVDENPYETIVPVTHTDDKLQYADDKLQISIDSYIKNIINNGGLVVNGTEDYDNLIATSDNTIINGLAGNDVISASNYDHCVLNGGDGMDYMVGGNGNNILNGGDGTDNIFGGAGSNILNGDSGLDYLIGGTGNDVINGGDGNDYIHNLGINTMDGFAIGDVNKPGNDILFGGAGADTFVFYGYTLGSNNVAKIMDFVSGTDYLMLAAFDSIDYTKINYAESLVQGAGAVAMDADDFIIFDQTTGGLYYDADGNGAGKAVQLATLVGVDLLSIYDFF